jgi:hypothetical protein
MSNKRPLSEIQWFEKDEMTEVASLMRNEIDQHPTFRRTIEYKGWQIDFSGGIDGEDYWLDELMISPIRTELATKIINL